MAQDSSTAASDPSEEAAISPKVRRRLQECYEQGTKLMTQEKYDYDYVHSFLLQCVLHDPANTVYLEAFLENLHRKYNNNKRGAMLNFGGKGPIKKAVAKENWRQVLKLAAEALKSNPWDVVTLRAAAEACAAFGYHQAELRYLKNALAPNPQDAAVNRHCALSLARMGQFDQAISCWTRVDEAKRGDDEAQRMISELQIAKTIGVTRQEDTRPSTRRRAQRQAEAESKVAAGAATERREFTLTPRQELERAVANNPTDVESYFELADLHIAEQRLGDAAHVLNKAVAASGGNLKARERLEDIEILRKLEQITIAEKRATASGEEAAQQLADQLRQDLNRYELEVFNARSERYPNDLEAKFQLGVRLRKAGNYREAIPLLSEAAGLENRQANALLELGECLQRTKQYDKAMECYLRAVTGAATTEDVDLHKLARYRSGVLAAGLRNYDTAEEHLSALLALDPAYKDAAPRLDKIREIRHKG
ncbi:MAG: tetratricopeptide repeat protein [Planctomycetota bacterium]|nr:tetratricopeptide repeat protein [Planctomycetota bacterium]